MSNNNDDYITITIPDYIYEILLIIGIILFILGTITFIGIDEINIFGHLIYIDQILGIFLLPIGLFVICGYVTHKILPKQKWSFMVGFFLGILGVIIATCVALKAGSDNYNSSINNKYEDLQRIEKLKRNGTLTEKEYNTEKEKILRRD